VPARIDPEVLERPSGAARLERIEPDGLGIQHGEVDELTLGVFRRDPEDRPPCRQPRLGVAPVSLRGTRDLGQALRIAGLCSTNSKLGMIQTFLLGDKLT
jgi:hypothetical protein